MGLIFIGLIAIDGRLLERLRPVTVKRDRL